MKALYLLTLGLGLLPPVHAAWAQTSSSLYTQAQAEAGAGLYVQDCAMCHGDALAGKTFVKPETSPTIGEIFSTMVTSMPLDQPGSLTHEQYQNIMAYALNKSFYPAGSKKLTFDHALTDSRPFVNKAQ